MNTLFRSLLVWLLLLALPFQGFAAARMLPRVAPDAPPAVHAMHTAATLPPCHQGAMQHDAAPGTTVAATDAHGGKHGAKPDAGHQSKCASCCIGAAMAPALVPGLPLAPPQFVSIPFRAGHLPSVDPSLPERPPRSTLA